MLLWSLYHRMIGPSYASKVPRCYDPNVVCSYFLTQVIEGWTQNGGTLLMGYEMFRLLSTRKMKTRKRRPNAGPEVIDIDLEEKNAELQFGESSV